MLILEIGGSRVSSATCKRGHQMAIAERTPNRIRRAPYRILLIDDDAEIVGALGSALSAEGYHVRSTTHGADILRLISLVDPDVLVTDVIMEDIDTLEVIATLRQSRPNMKIIAISGNTHLLNLASKNGAHHILAKPFRLQRLSLLVKLAVL